MGESALQLPSIDDLDVWNVLNIAEKPAVARLISTTLSSGNFQQRRGESRSSTTLYEFNYTIKKKPCNMFVTAVCDQLMKLNFAEKKHQSWQCDPVDLFDARVEKYVPKENKEIKRILEKEIEECDILLLWLNCDREGENIAAQVAQVCTAVKRNLTIKRVRFSSLSAREICRAVETLDKLDTINQHFVDAVDARQEIDLRIGASFTRFQNNLLYENFAVTRGPIFSFGLCQFPILQFVVERFWENQTHKPTTSWNLNCSHITPDGGIVNFFSGMLSNDNLLFDMYSHTGTWESTASVINVTEEEKSKDPPHPLNTIELHKRASWYLNMSSVDTMKAAEDLYLSGFISYPRTETDNFNLTTHDLRAIVQQQHEHPEWGAYARKLTDPNTRLWRDPSNGGHDDMTHPPIHPTKFSTGESDWGDNHKKLYELVVRHFLACVSVPAVRMETIVEIGVGGDPFFAAGEQISACQMVIPESDQRDYLGVYGYESWPKSVIPVYTRGEKLTQIRFTFDKVVTAPPPLLNEGDLLSYMYANCIGTAATMHDHIKMLLDRTYATKDADGRFSPTKLGEALVRGYADIGSDHPRCLLEADARGDIEREIESISKGDKSKANVLGTILQKMKDCFLHAKSNQGKLLKVWERYLERSNNTRKRKGIE